MPWQIARLKWLHQSSSAQTAEIIKGMKAQLHNLRTALWWFQRQSEAKQSAGIGRSTAPKLPAFMNRVSPATSVPHRVSRPRSGIPAAAGNAAARL